MKYLKSYNESLRDKMVGKSDNDILKNSEKLSPSKKLLSGCIHGVLQLVKQSIKEGADIHSNNEMPLRLSIENGHIIIVKYLIDNGADVNNDYVLDMWDDFHHTLTYKSMQKYIGKTNESLRDKMTAKSETDIKKALDNLTSEQDYDKFLKNVNDYYIDTYADEVYLSILVQIGFDEVKENINDVLNSFNKKHWIEDIIRKYTLNTKDLKTFGDLMNLIIKIDIEAGDVYYRDEILKRLIKKHNIDKTKEIVREIIIKTTEEE